jgi:L-threonylcarbamoyladenylate synthase
LCKNKIQINAHEYLSIKFYLRRKIQGRSLALIDTDIDKAIELLEKGDLVGIPTETVYGLAANCFNAKAVVRVFEVKRRPSFDPLIAHAADIDHMLQFVSDVPDKAFLLAEKFWPGPLTIVLKKKDIIPDIVTSGLDTVAVRVPNHPITKALLDKIDFPLAAPSANPFGYISPTTAEHVNDQLGDDVPYILEGGKCSVGIESTIVGFDNDEPVIYRLGGYTVEEIEEVIGVVKVQTHSTSRPASPGMLESHYAPTTPIILGNISENLTKFGVENTGVLSFINVYKEIEDPHQYTLSRSGDMSEAATRLFSGLRHLDQLNLQRILVEPVPDTGLGRAINDRLKRASSTDQ